MKTFLIIMLIAGAAWACNKQSATIEGEGKSENEAQINLQNKLENYQNKPKFKRGVCGGSKRDGIYRKWCEIEYCQ